MGRGEGLDEYMPIMVLLLIQLIYAAMNLFTRAALLHGMSSTIFVVYRQAFGTIAIAPIAYFQGKRNSFSHSLNLRSFSLIFLMSLTGVTLNQNLYNEGLYLSSSSVAAAMTNLIPAVTFIIAVFAGMEKVNIRSLRSIAKIVGTLICVSGALVMALLRGPKLLNAQKMMMMPSKSIFIDTSFSEGTDDNWLLGCLFLLGVCFSWSLWLILQVPAYESHPNYISLSAWMCFMSTLQSAAVTLFLEPDLNAWKINSLLEFGSSLYAGVMGSAVAYCLQAWCISRKGPLLAAVFSPLSTLIVIVLAALLLHEEIYTGSLIGTIGVITGLYVVLWGKAEDVVEVKENVDPKLVASPTEEVKFLIDESCENIYCKTDLEEPLLRAPSSISITSHN